MRLFKWLVRAALFFMLFAFALKNQHEANVLWFFNSEWRAPMVFIVLAAFTLGCVLTALALAPRLWLHRRETAALPSSDSPVAGDLPSQPELPTHAGLALDSSHPNRHGI